MINTVLERFSGLTVHVRSRFALVQVKQECILISMK